MELFVRSWESFISVEVIVITSTVKCLASFIDKYLIVHELNVHIVYIFAK